MRPRIILIAAVVLIAAGLVAFKLSARHKPAVDQKAVAACQKQVKSTYSTLMDTSSLVAPATNNTISKQEQDALDNCVPSNTH